MSKNLTRKQQAVVEAAMDPKKTVTDIAKEAGVHRVSASRALQKATVQEAITVRRNQGKKALTLVSAGAEEGFRFLNEMLEDMMQKARHDKQGENGVSHTDIAKIMQLTQQLWGAKIDATKVGLSTEESEDADEDEMEHAAQQLRTAFRLGQETSGDPEIEEAIVGSFLLYGEIRLDHGGPPGPDKESESPVVDVECERVPESEAS